MTGEEDARNRRQCAREFTKKRVATPPPGEYKSVEGMVVKGPLWLGRTEHLVHDMR